VSETGGTRRRARVSHQACEPSPSAPAPWKEKTPDTHPSHPARACSGVLYYCAAKKTIRTMDEARKDYLHHAGRSPGPPALRTSNHGQRTLRSPTGTVTTALSTHCCCHCLQLPATACHCHCCHRWTNSMPPAVRASPAQPSPYRTGYEHSLAS
jgi:hypothetical protein